MVSTEPVRVTSSHSDKRSYPPELRAAILRDAKIGIYVPDIASRHNVPTHFVLRLCWEADIKPNRYRPTPRALANCTGNTSEHHAGKTAGPTKHACHHEAHADSRLVHIKVVGTKFVTIFRPVSDAQESWKRRAPEDRVAARTARPTRPQNSFKTEDAAETKTNPTLLICRRMIDCAIHDAQQMSLQTQDADVAAIARAWIEERIGNPVPELYEHNPEYKAAYRDAWCGSFDWCCYWL